MRARLYSYYGGKARWADELAQMIPKCEVYIEPFFGSGAVFFSLGEGKYERAVVNDKEEGVVHFIRVLAGSKGDELIDRLERLIPDEYDFKTAKRMELMRYAGCSDVERAVYFYITLTQSYNCLRKNFRNGMIAERYQKQIKNGLPEARKKLKGVEILQGDAYDVIEKYKDEPTAVLFLDSPYVHGTRSSRDAYYHEMSDADHVRMLLAVREAKAKCILCGYREEYDGLYDRYLLSNPAWKVEMIGEVAKPCANQRGHKGTKAKEWIWKNF